MTTEMVKLGLLNEDLALYPRTQIDGTHVGHILEALQAGVTMPPIVVDKTSLRIADGWHRRRAYIKWLGIDAEIPVELKKYRNDREIFEDAMRLNSAHGRGLTRFEWAICTEKAARLGIAIERAAQLLHAQVDTLKDLVSKRVGRMAKHVSVTPKGEHIEEPTPLKRTIRHMRDRVLTEQQMEVNARLSGMEALFYVNQVAMLVEHNLIDDTNENLMHALERLRDLLNKFLVDHAA